MQQKIALVMSNYNDSHHLINFLKCIYDNGWDEKEHRYFFPDEVIVIDDCSTDDSFRILKNIEESGQFPYLKVYKNEKNIGCHASLIEGAKLAESDFITGWSADDEVLPGYIKGIKGALGYNCSDVILCNAIIERDGGVYKKTVSKTMAYYSPDYLEKLWLSGTDFNTFGSVVRKTALISSWDLGKNLPTSFDWLYVWLPAFTSGLIQLPVYGVKVKAHFNSWGVRNGLKKDKEAVEMIYSILDDFPEIKNRVIRSKIFTAFTRSRAFRHTCFRILMRSPLWFRRFIYRKFYK